MSEFMKKASRNVDEYIARAPKDVRGKLKEIREAIQDVAECSGTKER